jgi:hypothetical protein
MIKLTSITFDDFLNQIDISKRPVPIDLSDVSFISPAILTQLCAMCFAFHRELPGAESKRIAVKLNDSIGPYLARTGFIKNINSIAIIEPKKYEQRSYSENRYGSNPMLIEVTKINSINLLPMLFHRIVIALRTKLKYSKSEAFDIVTALSEVCQNILEHNHKGVCGFIAMQAYTVRNKSFLEIGIADYGVGLLQTLKNNEKYGRGPHQITTHLEAIKLATRAGISQFDDPSRGTGLHHLLEIIKKYSGLVQIHTGLAKVRYTANKVKEWNDIGWKNSASNLNGVNIVLNLNAKTS